MARRIRINDLTYPELDVYARDREAQLKFRPAHQPGIFIAESPIVIERALDAGYDLPRLPLRHRSRQHRSVRQASMTLLPSTSCSQ